MMNVSPTQPRFAFFGTPEFAMIILEELELKGLLPALVVTAPDKPKGRKLIVSPSEVRLWTYAHNIPVLTPEKLKDEEFIAELSKHEWDLFVVAAYGKIIPKNILEMPTHGVLNVHPSLLPKFRGSSPIESAILSDEKFTGVTIMQLDEEMDHGPVLAQRERIRNDWPPKGSELTHDLAHFGGALLADIIPEWMNGLKGFPQDHTRATFTKKITKEDGLLDLGSDLSRYSKSRSAEGNTKAWTDVVFEGPYSSTSPKPTKGTASSAPDDLLLYRKIRAYDDWPGAYFFTERNGKQIRVRITDAEYENDALKITRVIPEGKKEMSYEDFLRGGK